VAIATVLVCVTALAVMAASQPRLGLSADGGTGALVLCFTQFVIGLATFRIVRSAAFRDWLRADWLAILACVWAMGAL
jgi:F0F1-type ATP synthase assembly protein I